MNLKSFIPKDLNIDDVLDAVGLERRGTGSSSFISFLGVFAAGAIVGGAVALMLAPTPGAELREKISSKVKSAVDRRTDGRTASGPEA